MTEKRNISKLIDGFNILREKLGDAEMLDSLFVAFSVDDLASFTERIARMKNLYIDLK